MLHWFDEAQFNEHGEFIYTYTGLGDYIATVLMIFVILIIIFRLGLLFRHYVYTGEVGDIERSFLGGIIEERFDLKYAFTGYHPGGLLFDFFILSMIAAIAVFAWAIYAVGGLLLLLAHIMRKRIAHKQKFIRNLKGEQFNE